MPPLEKNTSRFEHATSAARDRGCARLGAWPRSRVRWVCVGSVPVGFRGARFPAGAPFVSSFQNSPRTRGTSKSVCWYGLPLGQWYGQSRRLKGNLPPWLRNRAQRGTGWLPHAAGHSGTHRACPRARVRGYAPQARATSGRPRAPHRLWPVRGVCRAL